MTDREMRDLYSLLCKKEELDTRFLIVDYKEEYRDCRKELCRLCKRQSIFDSNWCKECRWKEEL